jgi:hypothetical protein
MSLNQIYRIFWIFVVAVTMICCCKPTFKLFKNYQNSPIVLKYDDIMDSLEEVELNSTVVFFISFDLLRSLSLLSHSTTN